MFWAVPEQFLWFGNVCLGPTANPSPVDYVNTQ